MNDMGRIEPVIADKVDVEALSRNLARAIEQGGKALAAYMRPRESGEIKTELADEITDLVKTLGQVSEYWLSDPQRAVELQRLLLPGQRLLVAVLPRGFVLHAGSTRTARKPLMLFCRSTALWPPGRRSRPNTASLSCWDCCTSAATCRT